MVTLDPTTYDTFFVPQCVCWEHIRTARLYMPSPKTVFCPEIIKSEWKVLKDFEVRERGGQQAKEWPEVDLRSSCLIGSHARRLLVAGKHLLRPGFNLTGVVVGDDTYSRRRLRSLSWNNITSLLLITTPLCITVKAHF